MEPGKLPPAQRDAVTRWRSEQEAEASRALHKVHGLRDGSRVAVETLRNLRR